MSAAYETTTKTIPAMIDGTPATGLEGMGGRATGEIASRIAVCTMLEHFAGHAKAAIFREAAKHWR
jgi:hypothetical protein